MCHEKGWQAAWNSFQVTLILHKSNSQSSICEIFTIELIDGTFSHLISEFSKTKLTRGNLELPELPFQSEVYCKYSGAIFTSRARNVQSQNLIFPHQISYNARPIESSLKRQDSLAKEQRLHYKSGGSRCKSSTLPLNRLFYIIWQIDCKLWCWISWPKQVR